MKKVYIRTETDKGSIWKPMEEDIVSCLADPLKQGRFHIHNPNLSVLYDVIYDDPNEQYDKLWVGCKHFATNYSFTHIGYQGQTHIKSPEKDEKYIIPHMLDKKFIIQSQFISLNANVLKLMARGEDYLFNGNFGEFLKNIEDENYIFLKAKPDELELSFKIRIRPELEKSRKDFLEKHLDDNFVKRINSEYYHNLTTETAEELRQKFEHVI